MEESKGANSDNTVMIDTTGGSQASETPKRQPMLKLNKNRLGARRMQQAEEESKGMGQATECPFDSCGRKFVSD